MPSGLGHGLYKKIVALAEKYFSLYIYNNCYFLKEIGINCITIKLYHHNVIIVT